MMRDIIVPAIGRVVLMGVGPGECNLCGKWCILSSIKACMTFHDTSDHVLNGRFPKCLAVSPDPREAWQSTASAERQR
jgi:hypothetical protein